MTKSDLLDVTVKFRVSKSDYDQMKTKADAAGIAISELLRKSVGQTRIIRRKDWEQSVGLLCVINKQLLDIAQTATNQVPPTEAISTVSQLIRLERQIRSAVLKWGKS
jgi:hypothetical protein